MIIPSNTMKPQKKDFEKPALLLINLQGDLIWKSHSNALYDMLIKVNKHNVYAP